MTKQQNMAPAGEKITIKDNKLNIPNNPIIPYIEGDGIGRDITKAMKYVIDSAIEKAYGGEKRISWYEVLAGEKAFNQTGKWLPEETLSAIKEYIVAIKGPLTTPVGGGIRSLNVTLRQELDLYACVRPVRYFEGVPSPVKHPEKLNVVIFRENTEDVYAGIEWAAGSKEATKLIEYLGKEFSKKIRPDSGIGIKPMSTFGSKRLVKKAIEYALAQKKESVTLMHKGNIMKFTEGAFKEWGYAAAREYFPEQIITEEQLAATPANGKVIIKDRIADSMFQQVLLRPEEYSVIATPNLNGDYISDACAAQVGGLGMAPGANIGDFYAVFEATHGTAPKYADKDMINPGSLILSAVMMLEYLGWQKAADLTIKGLEQAIKNKTVTYDLERQMPGATKVSTSEFAKKIAENM